jgi:hypothetical protein
MREGDLRETQKKWNSALQWSVPYVILGFLLALLLKEDVLSSNPTLSVVIEWISRKIPSIDRISQVSVYPEVAKTFGAVMWVTQPVLTAVMIAKSPPMPIRKVGLSWLFIGYPLFNLVLIVVGVVIPFYFVDVSMNDLSLENGRGKAGLTVIVGSRFGMGTLGSLVFAISSFSQFLVIKALTHYPQLVKFNLSKREMR